MNKTWPCIILHTNLISPHSHSNLNNFHTIYIFKTTTLYMEYAQFLLQVTIAKYTFVISHTLNWFHNLYLRIYIRYCKSCEIFCFISVDISFPYNFHSRFCQHLSDLLMSEACLWCPLMISYSLGIIMLSGDFSTTSFLTQFLPFYDAAFSIIFAKNYIFIFLREELHEYDQL